MTTVLIIGFSSIVQRRVLRALQEMPEIDAIDVATRTGAVGSDFPKLGRIFSEGQEALSASRATLVYISLPNSMHDEWVRRSLQTGRHVVVDKPAALDLGASEGIVQLARQHNLLLAEATVFDFHPQFEVAKSFLLEAGGLTHVDAQFIIPPLPAANFRQSRHLGGGCLLDMGPYAAGIARNFGGSVRQMHALAAPSAGEGNVDVGFSLLADFHSGVRLTGHFSFESEYRNSVTLSARRGSLTLDRPFSLPADVPAKLPMRRENVSTALDMAPADTFLRFLNAVLAAIRSANHDVFHTTLLADAVFRDQLSKSLAKNS